MSRRSKPETIRQAAIVDALQSADRMVFRVQAGRVKVRGGWMHLAPKGTPDLYVVGWGFLETKTDEGELSPDQKKMHAELRARGERVAVVRTAYDAIVLTAKGRSAA